MHLHEILAWSPVGHGTLTIAAVSLAVSQFMKLGKSFLEPRFVEIEKVWRGASAKTRPQECLQDNLGTGLPEAIKNEDIHPANIPYIGGVINPWSGQVRHFMRSNDGISSFTACSASKAHIAEHLTAAFYKWREAIYFEEKWYKLETAATTFAQGNFELAAALHTIQDSYSPGHVARQPGVGFILNVHIWDDENRKADPARGWPGHSALDNPSNKMSADFFDKAKEACATIMVLLLTNLDQDPAALAKDLTNTLERYFHYAGEDIPSPTPAPAPGVFPPSPPPPGS